MNHIKHFQAVFAVGNPGNVFGAIIDQRQHHPTVLPWPWLFRERFCFGFLHPGKRFLCFFVGCHGCPYFHRIPTNIQVLQFRKESASIIGGGLLLIYLPLYVDYIVAECYLGFRPSELLDLDVTSYDRTNRAFIGGAKTDAGKNRTVTVSPKIQPIINRLTDKKIAGPVFCAADGSRMSIETYRDRFYEALEACEIANPITEINGIKRRKYTPHSCRHTFSTLMKNVQAPDKDKLALIGHTSTEMLRHYQDVDIESLRRITNAI